MDQSPELTNQKVTLYNWPANARNGYTGHSALRTYSGGRDGQGYHMSFYPHYIKETGGALLVEQMVRGSQQGKLLHYDYEMANSPNPPVEIDFYTLNVNHINQAYEQFCKMQIQDNTASNGRYDQSKYKWQLFGFHATKFYKNESHNCSSLALGLLKIGGIEHLIVRDTEQFEQVMKIAGLVEMEPTRALYAFMTLRFSITDTLEVSSKITSYCAQGGAEAGRSILGYMGSGIDSTYYYARSGLYDYFKGTDQRKDYNGWESVGELGGTISGVIGGMFFGATVSAVSTPNLVAESMENRGGIISPYVVHCLGRAAHIHPREQQKRQELHINNTVRNDQTPEHTRFF